MQDVFNLSGPEFLELYFGLLAGAIVLLFVLRLILRGPHDKPTAAGVPQLGALEVAYLSRGRRGTVDAAIAALAQRGVITVKTDLPQPRVRTTGSLPDDLSEVELAVYDAVERQFHGDAYIGPVRRLAGKTAETLADPLRAHELIMTPGRMFLLRLVPALPLFICLLIGLYKISIGTSRHRPVGYLAMLCIVTAVAALAAMLIVSHRTRRGDKLLEELRYKHDSIRTTSARHMQPADLALAFALFGPVVLASSPNVELYRVMQRSDCSTGSGCGSSCGSSCGGGGCGGGGCGGGGCGGCGS